LLKLKKKKKKKKAEQDRLHREEQEKKDRLKKEESISAQNENDMKFAKSFIDYYYGFFDKSINDRNYLVSLYKNESCLTFDTVKVFGAEQIIQRILTILNVKHSPITLDCQKTFGNGYIIYVSGDLLVFKNDNTKQALRFQQIFTLLPNVNSIGYWVSNEILKVSYS